MPRLLLALSPSPSSPRSVVRGRGVPRRRARGPLAGQALEHRADRRHRLPAPTLTCGAARRLEELLPTPRHVPHRRAAEPGTPGDRLDHVQEPPRRAQHRRASGRSGATGGSSAASCASGQRQLAADGRGRGQRPRRSRLHVRRAALAASSRRGGRAGVGPRAPARARGRAHAALGPLPLLRYLDLEPLPVRDGCPRRARFSPSSRHPRSS